MRTASLLFALLFLLAACSPTVGPEEPGVVPVPTATHGAVLAPGETPPEETQPITAEEALFVFLTAYESNPDEMLPFLSAELLENLPPGGIFELLGFDGTLEGLVFTTGTTAGDPSLAMIEAQLQVDGKEIRRIFYLERQGGRWLITRIEQGEL